MPEHLPQPFLGLRRRRLRPKQAGQGLARHGMMPMEQEVAEKFLELARLEAVYHLFLSPQREVPKKPDRYPTAV